ncbi:N-acetyltransferase 9 [Coemansia biformis]|uniref:N-acetyltransferase 9 n=1 Tax=Coemansia biformis TaxID=1286918 RepID=A0A9W8CY78_9FUNG|nr:N-acetyltransferase 9 [Coemansia biformis]
MKSPFLQEMTGSEPLTIDEEYAMQQSWRADSDKPPPSSSSPLECTFIVLAKDRQARPNDYDIYDNGQMIGDVNFYLNNTENPLEAELEVMLAEDGASGKGIATEVLALMMHYAANDVGVTDFVARIKEVNDASIHIFTKKLGFVETERSQAFKEVTLRRKADNELRSQLDQLAGHAVRTEYKTS